VRLPGRVIPCRCRRIVTSLLLVLLLCAPVPVVQVAAEDGSPTRHCVFTGSTIVTVRYIHSVERTPVQEMYEARLAGLRLREVRWQSFGAGLPDEYDLRQDDFYVKRVDVGLGRRLDYWFLPLNAVRISVGKQPAFEGPAVPALVSVRVRLVPLVTVIGDPQSFVCATEPSHSATGTDEEHRVEPFGPALECSRLQAISAALE